jgi:ligand-binding sensor domain-containing protein
MPALSQGYNYVHYDTKDGLPGSTVYSMCQDKKGYMWFATNNGVSRFDGKKFTNFTTENGLTDNEVLYISADSKGRVWISPFDKTLCYYYEGKIHSAKNDSTLKNILFSSYGVTAGENEKGDIYISTLNGIFLYKKSGQIKHIGDFEKLARQYSLPVSDFLWTYLPYLYPYNFLLFNGQSVFISKGDSFVYLKKVKSNIPKRNNFYKVDKDLRMHYIKSATFKAFKSINFIDKNDIFFNTLNGSWHIDSLGHIDPRPFLPGKTVSFVFRDDEGNTWFSTLGEGVYRLTSKAMKTFGNAQESFCITKTNGRIYAGLTEGNLLAIKDLRIEKIYPFEAVSGQPSSRRLYTLKADPSGSIYMGYDIYLAKRDNSQTLFSFVNPIKSIDIVDENSIVVCTNAFTFRMRSADLKIADTILRERGTKVIYDKGSYYIGTLSGLVIVGPGKTITRTGTSIPLLSKRIVDMCKAPDGGFWIATNDNGILLYKNGQADTVITLQNGLSSNTCNSLFLKDRYLWVGTNKGVNKVDIITKKVLAKYSTADGLPSDIINAVYADDSIIWVSSPAGLTYFKEKDIAETSVCKLDLHSAHVSGKEMDMRKTIYLSYKNNNISFDYAAISFKSAGDIVYRYKLNGLDDDWKETRLTTLPYPSLPPGDYKLQLYAINKFGKHSDTAVVQFHIAAPFWKTAWFWLTSAALFVIVTWHLLSRRYTRLQQRVKEKTETTKRITELEQASLRAQMNPHFIFNCLNSIQAFIIRNDMEQTNKYITQFGNLIRQTLDNSAKAGISITDELTYLTTYMNLEQMRFSSKFQYIISLDPGIQADYTFIPSMLLQPFVENAIRHGIRNKKDGEGIITISIRQAPGKIVFSIEDNGIGREAAMKYKSGQHIAYQSKGITLTQNRIEVLNSISPEKIVTEITDITDESGNVAGTKVVISFPRSAMEKPGE